MTRQQRRYEERKQEKEKQRKHIEEVVFNRYKGFIPSKGVYWNVRTEEKLHPTWRETHRSIVVDVNINNIEKVVVAKFNIQNPYIDEMACMKFGLEVPEPDEIVDEIDLLEFHRKGKVKGLPDLWKISNTGFCNTRPILPEEMSDEYPYKPHFHPYIVFRKYSGKQVMYPMDSKFLFVWNDDGDLVQRDQTFYHLAKKDIELGPHKMGASPPVAFRVKGKEPVTV